MKEAHEEPDEVKAPEETADDEAALEEESNSEATYEERVEAWAARFSKEAHGSRAEKKSAKFTAATTRIFRATAPLRKIEFLKGETIKGTFSGMKAAPRVKKTEESPLPRKEAVKKGSLARKEEGPRVQIESGNNEGALGDRGLSNDDFEVECGCNVDHQVVGHD